MSVLAVEEAGLRTTDYGLRTADYGLRPADYGLRTTDYGLPPADYGLRPADCGLRTILRDETAPLFSDSIETDDFRASSLSSSTNHGPLKRPPPLSRNPPSLPPMMVLSHPSTPQHRTAPRNLWPSPAFSDYFSSNDEHESQVSPCLVDGHKINPPQQRIFFLLNEIGQQALRVDLGDRSAGILEEELGHIVQRLNAPESQSRKPAELADSGLFIDDDDIEDGMDKGALEENSERNARELIQGQEAVARICKVTGQLQQRYQDIHNINDLAISRLQSAADEIISLRSENEHFHLDLSDFYNAMLVLKMQISTFEAQAAPYMTSEEGNPLRKDVERWKMAWRGVEKRLDSRRHFYEHSSQDFLRGTDKGVGNGMSSSMHSSADLSPPVYRSNLTIRRPGLTARPHSDPFIEQQSKPFLYNQLDQQRKLGDKVQSPLKHLIAQCEDLEVEQCDSNEQAIVSDDDETLLSLGELDEENKAEDGELEQGERESKEDTESREQEESDSEELPRKSAWQELWDGLSEYAGILDYSD
ncbi:girdin isoform x5 [Venturia nashicola]|uniref:Girdin isoform x5 n=1 Tax=Venturia nashicola TaxID=86259 RepID=A0A4Z1PM25_9PEZI|nr:girdin isoform x5 [Venturia nashicola]